MRIKFFCVGGSVGGGGGIKLFFLSPREILSVDKLKTQKSYVNTEEWLPPIWLQMKSLLVSLKALDLFQAKSANLTIALQKEMDKRKSAPLFARFVASVFINDQSSLSPIY